jgi:hypothetical protein
MVMVALPSCLLAALSAMGGLRIETDTPAALCPGIASVREAAATRVGQIEGIGTWVASYGLVHRPEDERADVVRLEIRDPAGELRLQRDLPRAGQSCTAVAQAMVLVLESFFRRTTDSDGARTPAAPAGIANAAMPPAATPSIVPALDLVGGWTAGPSGPSVALGVRMTGFSEGRWEAGVGAAWLLARQEQAVGSARATNDSYAFRLHVGRRWRSGHALIARLGPEVVLVLDRAATSGVPDATTSFRAGFGVGAVAGLETFSSRRFAVSIVAAADYTPSAWAGQYVISNYGGPEVFPPPSWRLLIAAGFTVSLAE